jgi:hypothetical protein
MLRLITSEEAAGASGDVLDLIYKGKVETTRRRVQTSNLLITEVQGQPYGRYFQLIITDGVDEEDVDELRRLSDELGKNLPDCVVKRTRVEEPHPWFPGSSYFDLVMVYGG